MKTGRTFSRGWAAKTCGLPSGHTVGIPASATVSLLALSTAVPSSRTSAKTESFISLTLATAWPGLYASSLTTTRSLRPFTPPAALTCLAQASAASEIDPHAAAGPERGAVIPSTTSLSVTPGAAATSNAASSMSGLLRGGRSIAHSDVNRQRTRKEIVKPRRIGPDLSLFDPVNQLGHRRVHRHRYAESFPELRHVPVGVTRVSIARLSA